MVVYSDDWIASLKNIRGGVGVLAQERPEEINKIIVDWLNKWR